MLFAETFKSLNDRFGQRRDRWIAKRHPPNRQISLRPKRIYILPTSACAGLLLLLLVLALLAINYENNLVYGLVFLLVATLQVGMVHTHANLRTLSIESGAVLNSFAGEPSRFDVRLHASDRAHRNIRLFYPGGDSRSLSLEPGESLELELSGAAGSRGWFHPGYLKVETRYPLGIFRAWSWIDLGQTALIYPRPIEGGELPAVAGQGEALQEKMGGQDEFAGFAEYQPGMPIRQLAWKQYARGQGLYTKRFNDQVAEGTWLSWSLWPELGREARLSRLCFWALKLNQRQIPFGLDLPNLRIDPAQDESHLRRVLKALATFGVEGGIE